MNIDQLLAYDKKHENHAGTSAEEKQFLYGLMRMMRPEIVIEIGVSAGHSTCWIAKALQDNGGGNLISVDNWSRAHGGAAQGPGTARKRLKDCGLDKYVKLVTMDSQVFLKQRADRGANIVWVDGDHSYERAKLDTQQALRVARDMVIVHDTFQNAYDTVRRACKDIGGGTFIDGFRGMWLRHV